MAQRPERRADAKSRPCAAMTGRLRGRYLHRGRRMILNGAHRLRRRGFFVPAMAGEDRER